MLEIRFRVTTRPHPYGPWFADAPEARVSALNLRYSPDGGSCTLVGLGPGLDGLARAMRRHPMPDAGRWDVAPPRGRLVLARASWPEPAPSGRSPARIAWEAYGDRALLSSTFHAGHAVHRVHLPDGEDGARLWPLVREEIERQRARAGSIRCEIERVAERRVRPDPGDPAFVPAVEAGLGMGALDQPAAATPLDVAAFLDMDARTVEAYLLDVAAARPRAW